MLENHQVLTRANDPTDPRNAEDWTGRCDECGERSDDRKTCSAHGYDRDLCPDCRVDCEGCKKAFCKAHAKECLSKGACEDCACSECGHALKHHSPEYGCEVERGDGWIGDVYQALGPCGCKGEER